MEDVKKNKKVVLMATSSILHHPSYM